MSCGFKIIHILYSRFANSPGAFLMYGSPVPVFSDQLLNLIVSKVCN